jgi:hypothetical protein
MEVCCRTGDFLRGSGSAAGNGESGLDFIFLIKGNGVSARVGCINVVGGRESRWIESQSGDLGGVVGTV